MHSLRLPADPLPFVFRPGAWSLDRRNIEAIATLPRLRSLIIDNDIAEDAVLEGYGCVFD
jgi:hypothetical protein